MTNVKFLSSPSPDHFNYCTETCPRAKGAQRRSGRKPGARVLIPPGYLHLGKRKHWRSLKFINDRGRDQRSWVGGHPHWSEKYGWLLVEVG
jgi:hypothetical protein